MAAKHEPMQQVRKNFRIHWYRCPIERNTLKELTQRHDLKGMFQAVGHIALIAITGAATYFFFTRGIWIGFALSLFAHGTIYSFLSGLATHELSHGTVFKKKWLNGLFLRVFSLISWFNFHDYKLSHTYHHLYTLHPRGDREVTLPIKPSLHPLHLLQLFTVNFIGWPGEPWSWPLVPVIGSTGKLAFTGKFNKEWLETIYADEEDARKKSINWARMILLFHAALIAVSIIFRLWPLPLLVTFAPFIANWWRYFVGAPMHTGLKDNVPDFRLCVRTITIDPFSSFLYWRMNWHTEHHMFAAVPCYNLRKLSKTVAFDMPEPRTLVGAWREMRQTWKKQQEDPGYQYETPLPVHTGNARKKHDPSESSLGDLSPKTTE
jgi:fatty acid desaturase